MSREEAPTARRMTAEERRESILGAAIAVFGARGYEGATTDDVARAAGVSQPYVVRMFGTKEKLFLAATDDVVDRILEAFRAAVPGDDDGRKQRMGRAYVDLLADRGVHLALQHAFLQGGHPVIGPAARAHFVRVWRFLRDEAGFDPETARAFLAEGMLINTIVGLRLIDDYDSDPGVAELFNACFPTHLAEVAGLVPRVGDSW